MKQQKNVTSVLKSLMNLRIEKLERSMPLHGFVSWCSPQQLQPEILNADHIRIVFQNLSGYDTHLFIKEVWKNFLTRIILEPLQKTERSILALMSNKDVNPNKAGVLDDSFFWGGVTEGGLGVNLALFNLFEVGWR